MRLATLLDRSPSPLAVGARDQHAERLVRAVLETLAERLPPSCVVRLVQELPAEVSTHLASGSATVSGEPFSERVRSRCELGKAITHAELESAIGSVLRSIADRLPVADVERMRGNLGQAFDHYFDANP